MECRDKIIASGASHVPRSCPTCKFGPCALSSSESKYKYAAIVKDYYHTASDYRRGLTPEYFKRFLEFDDAAGLLKWVEENNSCTTKLDVIKYVKFSRVDIKYHIELEDI